MSKDEKEKTRSTKRRVLEIIAVSCLSIIFFSIVFLGISSSTPLFRDTRNAPLNKSVAQLREIKLDGIDQWVLLRGKNRDLPLLLWIHGGPGSPQMPFAHYLDRPLEEHFIVVHWDQRGAGKTNPSLFDRRFILLSGMSLIQFKKEALELIEYLLKEFHQEKLFLLGHSWGSQIGLELAIENPELFHAYISVSQVVETEKAMRIAHEWLSEQMQAHGDLEKLAQLEAMGLPPYSHSEYRTFIQWVNHYGGSLDWSISKLLRVAAFAQEYSAMDYYKWFQGMNRGGKSFHKDGMMSYYNYFDRVPSLSVPVYFIAGEKDYNTPFELIEQYYEYLQAPQKELIPFSGSAHTPFFADPERFREELIRIKDNTLE